jgi:protein-tyrosine phosphatase
MARALVDLGYGSVAPSPHARANYAGPEVTASRLEQVRQALEDARIPLALYSNAENFLLEDGFFDQGAGPARRPLGNGPWVLVEVPYQAPVPALGEMVFRLRLQGVQPLFAHPERCQEFVRPGRAREIQDAGALFQLDLGSLTGRYGVRSRKVAQTLLEDEVYSVAATDLHSPEDARVWVGAALEELERRVGSIRAQALTDEHPKRLLQGLPLAG